MINENISNKKCPRCLLSKEILEFGTHNLRGVSQIDTYCKICLKQIGNEKWLLKKKKFNIPNKDITKIYEVKEINGIIHQKCIMCLKFKLFGDFNKSKNNSHGISRYCKKCSSIKDKNNYQTHKTSINKRNNLFYKKNKLIIGEKSRLKRKNDISFRLNESIRSKKWRMNNKDLVLQKKKEYYNKNKKKIHKQMLEYRWSNINVRIKQNLRSRIWHALKHGNKKEHFYELIGCSTEQLKIHIEQQFKDNMTWDNYGKEWHMDHIKPCCKFDMTDRQQRMECFNYKNLQPLWKQENMIKNRF